MRLVIIEQSMIEDLVKKSCHIDTVHIDKNYENDFLPELLSVYNDLNNNLLFYDIKMKKTRNILTKYYSNKITKVELDYLGYTEKCCVNLDKKEIDLAIEVNEFYIQVRVDYELTKNNIKNIETVISKYKFRYQDIKNLIEYNKMVGNQ